MINRFTYGTGDISPEQFAAVWESMRSDVEQHNPTVQIYDPESPDLKQARRLADEIIHVSGAPVKVFVRTENGAFDQVFDEDPDPTYWTPIHLKAYFKPQPIELELKKWGPDSANKTDVVFSHREIYAALGERMLRVGDVIQLPYNAATLSPKNYRVLNSTPSGNFRYHWLYLTCQVETLTADITVRPEDDLQQEVQPEPSRYVESSDN